MNLWAQVILASEEATERYSLHQVFFINDNWF